MNLHTSPLPKKIELDGPGFLIDESWDLTGAPDRVTDSVWHRYFPLSGSGARHIVLTVDTAMEKEAYRADLSTERIDVKAGGPEGLRDAAFTLYQLMGRYDALQCGTISDEPFVKNIRGYHFNLTSFRNTDMPMMLQMLRWMAEAKLNTVMIEYDNRFPYAAIAGKPSRSRLSAEDVLLLNRTANELGLAVIPHLQTFGHLSTLLSDPRCESIREVKESPAQVCPLNPDSIVFVRNAIDEFTALHPGARYLHIGGDETRQLGKCPKCAAFVEKYGVGRLYAEYMNQVIDYTASKGLIPMVYDDMVCAHPEALDLLDRRAVLVNWDYWAVTPKTPHILARYGHVYLCDKRWMDGTWTSELEDVEKSVLHHFVTEANAQEDLIATLGPDYMARYGAYLGDEIPKRFRAFPYLEYYQDKGFKVVGMPTAMGNHDNYLGLPNQTRFMANIRVCAERVVQAGALGVISSNWFTFPAPFYPLGIVTTGSYTWGLPDYMPDYPGWDDRW